MIDQLKKIAKSLTLNIEYGYYKILKMDEVDGWTRFELEIDEAIFKISINENARTNKGKVLIAGFEVLENYLSDDDFRLIFRQLYAELITA